LSGPMVLVPPPVKLIPDVVNELPTTTVAKFEVPLEVMSTHETSPVVKDRLPVAETKPVLPAMTPSTLGVEARPIVTVSALASVSPGSAPTLA